MITPDSFPDNVSSVPTADWTGAELDTDGGLGYASGTPFGVPSMTLPSPLISASADRLGGEPCFTGTRVPVRTLIDYVEGGHALGEFLQDFPSVTREHAVAVLELARQALLSQAVVSAT
jgi:uncharacterized protein (DUF433 family)